jgi:hypothetical protein
MRLKELIEKLNAFLDEHGNVEVVIGDSGTEAFEDIVVVDYDKDGSNWNHVMLISEEFEESMKNG